MLVQSWGFASSVVDQGRPHISTEVVITVTSVLQTPAGRMIFGRIEGKSGPGDIKSDSRH